MVAQVTYALRKDVKVVNPVMILSQSLFIRYKLLERLS